MRRNGFAEQAPTGLRAARGQDATAAGSVEIVGGGMTGRETPGLRKTREARGFSDVFVAKRREAPTRVSLHQVTASFWIDGGVYDDKDMILDAGYFSDHNERQAWLGGKSGRVEMMSVAVKDRAQRPTHDPGWNVVPTFFGTC